jgi:hypothetical protein
MHRKVGQQRPKIQHNLTPLPHNQMQEMMTMTQILNPQTERPRDTENQNQKNL